MLEWIAEPIVTLGASIAIDRLLVIVALASLGLAWLAHRKQRNPLVWSVAALGGFAAEGERQRLRLGSSAQEVAAVPHRGGQQTEP